VLVPCYCSTTGHGAPEFRPQLAGSSTFTAEARVPGWFFDSELHEVSMFQRLRPGSLFPSRRIHRILGHLFCRQAGEIRRHRHCTSLHITGSFPFRNGEPAPASA